MVVEPFIPVALVLACGVMAVWCFWWSSTTRHAIVVATIGTPLLSFILPGFSITAVEVAATGYLSLTWNVEIGAILGAITAVLAIPCGPLVGWLAREASLWLFPAGEDRGPSESLASLSRRLGGTVTLKKGLLTILASTLLFAAIGCGIGLSLGIFAPDYYRELFRHDYRDPKHERQINPVTIGVSLGLGQGATGGAIVGLALVAIVAWYDLRRQTLRQWQWQDFPADVRAGEN